MPNEPDHTHRYQYRRDDDRDDRQTIGFAGWGVNVSVSGIYTIIILLLCLFIVAIGYMAIQSFTTLRLEHGQLMAEMKVQNFLLSLPEAERPRLIPPPGFYDRVDRRRESKPEAGRREDREKNRELEQPLPEVPHNPSLDERRERWGDTGDGKRFVPVPE